MTINIFTVIGCRPQFVKASALTRKFNENINSSMRVNETFIHTGQHYDYNMSEQFFEELEIPKPKYNCGISGGTHGENTGRMIEKIEKIIINKNIDYLLVYGDTDSTLAGAIAASKLRIPILHVEAGLRSYNKNQPEEINRVLTDHISEICFAPTENARDNLIREGISEKKIALVGDVMEDMKLFFSSQADKNIKLKKKLSLEKKEYALVTIHRKENTQDSLILENILRALSSLDINIIFPLHPSTENQIEKFKLTKYLKNMEVIKPVGYIDMSTLEKFSKVIITDSGGVQKEAYFHKVPCVTIRKETEWIELIKSGWNKLANPENIESIQNAFNTQLKFNLNNKKVNYYGNGDSAQKILEFILSLSSN